MIEPLVSIIMPAYNAGQFIAESIESVIAQTYINWELLIVDDGSTDKTGEIIKSFCRKDKRIQYYYQQNGKQGKARNLALKHAAGELIAFLDADDIWLAEKLYKQILQIREKNVDLVFADAYMFTNTITHEKIMNSGKGFFNGEQAVKYFLGLNKIPILTVLMKAETLRDAQGFSENILLQNAEDYHLWLRLLMSNKKLFGSQLVLAAYREHKTSSTNTDNLAISKVVEVLKDLKQGFPKYTDVINFYFKRWFEKYQSIGYKEDYKSVIKKNCSYVGKPSFNFMFQAMYSCFGFNITKKLMNKIINKSIAF